jgi:hypothetical protein
MAKTTKKPAAKSNTKTNNKPAATKGGCGKGCSK